MAITDCPDDSNGIHSFEELAARVRGLGAGITGVYLVCRQCGGVKFEERERIVEEDEQTP